MKPRNKFLHSGARSGQRGMTLVEVLVTLIIISVGLLGVAALQLASLRNNYDAYVRSQAAVLAGDILDRMRVNRTVALDPAANPYTVDSAPYNQTGTAAQRDITDWKATLLAQLPNGRGSITRNPNDTFTIVVQWGERDGPINFTTNSAI